MRLRTIAFLAPLACTLALAGCGKPKPAANSLDAMDAALTNGAVANDVLPAGAIKVDPAKARACKSGDCRPATTSLAEAARRQAEHKPALVQGEALADNGAAGVSANGDCIPGLAYSNAWAAKLPADLPMMPGATLSEAAGRDTPCILRIVSFSAPGDRAAVMAWYAAKAKAAGYSADRADKGGDAILAGDKADGSAYYLIIGATAGGRTPVDYVWTRG